MERNYSEALRYDYPLTAGSVVLDCGGHLGEFAEGIARKHGCTVIVLEPVLEFYRQCCLRIGLMPGVRIHPFGIGAATGFKVFGIHGGLTGEFCGDSGERVEIMSVNRILELFGIVVCDLIKLNIEGGEFEVLEDMLSQGTAPRFRHIQVQWHEVVPDAAPRREAIMTALGRTHEVMWDFGWVWQSWRIKES